MAALGIVLTALLSMGGFGLVFWLLRGRRTLASTWLLVAFVLGSLQGCLCFWLENLLWSFTGLEPTGGQRSGTEALVAMMVLAVPLEESSKLVSVWPLYQRGLLKDRSDGILAAVIVAAGFSIAETAMSANAAATGIFVARALLSSVAHLLFAGAWGFVLSDASGGRFLRRAFLLAVLFHGLFDHIVFGRGAGTLVVAGPLLFGMVGLAWLGLREAQNETQLEPVLAQALSEPTFKLFRRVVRRGEKPVSLFWIGVGAFVTTGVSLSAVALAIFVGHKLGIDFASANESDVRANTPLLLLGSALMAAFPIAGYLVAKASGTDSVLEPALGTAAAIAIVAVLLSMAAPVAVVFSVAVAPVAFGLACLGAWFAMGR